MNYMYSVILSLLYTIFPHYLYNLNLNLIL
nr:MAG TPA: hypothetical protein [Caudoviricetes sp.]